MKHLLLISAAALILGACGDKSTSSKTAANEPAVSAKVIQAENQRIDAFFEERFQAAVERSPQFMTQLGMKKDYDKWDDQSKEAYLADLAITKQNLKDLRDGFDINKLDESHALSYRLFELNAENEIRGEKWYNHRYPFNQMFGAQSGIPAFMINFHRVSDVSDAKAYIARLNGVKDYMGTMVAYSKESASKGIMPPKFVYDHVIRDAGNITKGAPFDNGKPSTLLADFTKKVKELKLPGDEEADLIKQAETALTSSVKPAYDGLVAEMNRQKSIATADDGAWKLPNGGDFYAHRLNLMTTTDMSASEIHDLGLAEVDRIHGEMRQIMKQVGFTGTLQEFFVALKEDPAQTYPDTDAGRAAYLSEATDMIDIMKTRLDEVFLRKPKADMVVKRVEAFREKSAGKAFYNRPAPDGSRPGTYYANLYNIADMPKYQMEALAYHEGIPGHHMQIAIAQELEGIPRFRKFGRFTAYSEGWGLYSEYLPKEMGFYSDPYSDFGRLSMEIWRAARLVVDTGLHDKKWTREQAIDYLLTNTPNPEGDCIKAIERYIVMPGQATAYKIGMIKILELREMAKGKLGDKFDIREYHDVILASGAVPLSIMEERVNKWIKSKA